MKYGIESDVVTLPSVWASALVNNDYSGLTRVEADRCEATVNKLSKTGWYVVSTLSTEDVPWFTSNYDLYDPGSGFTGGYVMHYVVHRYNPT